MTPRLEMPELLGRMRPRRRAYGVGLPRSGTHSLANMFGRACRAAHEPRAMDVVPRISEWLRLGASPAAMAGYLRDRDRRLGLDFESAHYLHHVAGLLVDLFPESRFVLTIREPLSWLASEANQNVRSRDFPFWRELEACRYGHYRFRQEFPALESVSNLYPIRSYLGYWKDHITRVLEAVPPERLSVVDTFELSAELDTMATFLGLDRGRIDESQARSDRRIPEFDLFGVVDRQKVHAIVRDQCGPFIEETVPMLRKYLD